MTPERALGNVALIGFMGAGKSAVGQLTAALLDFQFLDTDSCIEEQTGKPVPRIFAEDGEVYFRACEARLVEALAGRRGLVIGTGGGLAANPEHLARLKSFALVVWLWASPETLWERTRHQGHRPLLQTADPLARIRGLLADREPVYRQADVLVNTERRAPKEVAQLVVSHYRAARERSGVPPP